MYNFTTEICFQCFGGLTLFVPGMLGDGNFKKVKPGFGVVLFEMWRYLGIGCFDTCLKEKYNGRVIKTRDIYRVPYED